MSREVVIISGITHPLLADLICNRLGMKRCPITLFRAANRETLITLPESVRSRDVYIVQTATRTNVNDAIMELLLMGYTCKTSAAKNIVGIIPYLPYGKQTKQRKRGAIPSKLLAKLICRAGFTHIVTVDLHHREIQGFFDIPVENLRASPFLISHVQEIMLEQNIDRSQLVVVARHTSSMKKATAYASRLRTDIAVLHGSTEGEMDDNDDGRSSPPPIRSFEMAPGDSLPMFTSHDVFRPDRRLNLVGDVVGKIAIIVDDILDDVEQFIVAARFLKESHGAHQVIVLATHALFSPNEAIRLEQSVIDQIVVTNTVPTQQDNDNDNQANIQFTKLKIIDIGILLTEAIRRLHNQESLSYLFNDVSVED